MKTKQPRTLQEAIQYMKDLRELGYEPYLKGMGNGEVKIVMDVLVINGTK
jgi:hypothetical protein